MQEQFVKYHIFISHLRKYDSFKFISQILLDIGKYFRSVSVVMVNILAKCPGGIRTLNQINLK